MKTIVTSGAGFIGSYPVDSPSWLDVYLPLRRSCTLYGQD